jgi:hypothetical protein
MLVHVMQLTLDNPSALCRILANHTLSPVAQVTVANLMVTTIRRAISHQG